MKRIYITGSKGYLGEKLIEILQNNFIVNGSDKEVDVTNLSKLNNAIMNFTPAILIHTAALSNIYDCEKNPILAQKINVNGTKNIVKISKHNNIKLVYISSDYIFSGKKGRYTESDSPDPINVYGKTKKLAEEEVKKLKNYLIIRTSTLYGYNKNNKKPVFVNRIIQKLANNELCFVATDQISNPTLIDDLAKSIAILIKRGEKGIWNVAGPEAITRYKLAIKIAEIFELNKDLIKPSTIDKLGLTKIIPRDCSLVLDKLEKENIILNSIEKGLKIMKAQINNDKKQISAGTIFYTVKNGKTSILMVKHRRGHWGFPKGKIELGESLADCAKREVLEEIGFKIKNFENKEIIKTKYVVENGIEKEVTYFVFRSKKFKPKLSNELIKYEWVPLNKVHERAEFSELNELIKKLIIVIG